MVAPTMNSNSLSIAIIIINDRFCYKISLAREIKIENLISFPSNRIVRGGGGSGSSSGACEQSAGQKFLH